MVQPIRPHDASGIYRREVSNSAAVEAAGDTRRAGSGASTRRTDRVTLSEGAREFARIMQDVQRAPDVRADRVAALRQQIEAGEYVVDHTGLAALLADRGFAS
ncbi:MAG: flagellar biosynthesis anti-sigma factor FlgM [Dehalococcoidia bacterium]|nr:flagellar biosynthesis anti-sigma factor FlgM [Dehalococcoidia bacterium]